MLDVLEARFDMVPLDIIKTIQGIDEIVMLESLLKKTIKVENLDEFRNILKKSLHSNQIRFFFLSLLMASTATLVFCTASAS